MIKGIYFDGNTSNKTETSLSYSNDGEILFADVEHEAITFDSIKISSRLGETPRYINFQDGTSFETNDNNAIDEMEKKLSNKRILGLAHKLESAKFFVVFTVIAVILFSWLFVQYGIPSLSRQIANMLPEEASQYMGQGVLDVMDKSWFSESKLSKKKQKELNKLFNGLLANIEDSERYKLNFRLGGKIKANAFALPDGNIVFTDELINLTEDKNEIASIMLHEIGHLKSRHSIRATIQQFSLAMFVMVVTGDVSSSSSIITAIPLMLVESGFSQDMETEADTYSLEYMHQHNIDPSNFATMMEKLVASFSPEFEVCMDTGIKDHIKCINKAISVVAKDKNNEKNALDYFSTHPSSTERMERFRVK